MLDYTVRQPGTQWHSGLAHSGTVAWHTVEVVIEALSQQHRAQCVLLILLLLLLLLCEYYCPVCTTEHTEIQCALLNTPKRLLHVHMAPALLFYF